MSTAENAALEALHHTVALINEVGLTTAMRDLQREVWATNLGRHEPDELGDTARSLGLLCHENYQTRAVRRFRHDDAEPSDKHWDIDGLKVTTPSGVLTFEIGGVRIVGMKVPPAERRSPRWDRVAVWDNESNTRLEIATKNSRALGGFSTPDPGQEQITDFHHELGRVPGPIRDFLYVWAGEAESPLTSGWLTVPALGGNPFAAVAPLWHDTDDDLPRGTRSPLRDPHGPSFDQIPAAKPAVSLKPASAAEGKA